MHTIHIMRLATPLAFEEALKLDDLASVLLFICGCTWIISKKKSITEKKKELITVNSNGVCLIPSYIG